MGREKTNTDDDEFLRRWVLPEEDRAQYIAQPWGGEFRWFKAEKIICLEKVRKRRCRLTPVNRMNN